MISYKVFNVIYKYFMHSSTAAMYILIYIHYVGTYNIHYTHYIQSVCYKSRYLLTFRESPLWGWMQLYKNTHTYTTCIILYVYYGTGRLKCGVRPTHQSRYHLKYHARPVGLSQQFVLMRVPFAN